MSVWFVPGLTSLANGFMLRLAVACSRFFSIITPLTVSRGALCCFVAVDFGGILAICRQSVAVCLSLASLECGLGQFWFYFGERMAWLRGGVFR